MQRPRSFSQARSKFCLAVEPRLATICWVFCQTEPVQREAVNWLLVTLEKAAISSFEFGFGSSLTQTAALALPAVRVCTPVQEEPSQILYLSWPAVGGV